VSLIKKADVPQYFAARRAMKAAARAANQSETMARADHQHGGASAAGDNPGASSPAQSESASRSKAAAKQ
jgi:hypothetical protein